ncbi:response regulator [Dactylosporangium sp. NPDC050588]|uniref:response regulator n=1 Tax=Dactylosporangium sp. NPDC050588 TaxID=3157211 RepID=UPI0033CF1CCE
MGAATVLVAEDDPDIRELFTMALESAGASVVAVTSGGEALEALRKDQFDLVSKADALVGGRLVARDA